MRQTTSCLVLALDWLGELRHADALLKEKRNDGNCNWTLESTNLETSGPVHKLPTWSTCPLLYANILVAVNCVTVDCAAGRRNFSDAETVNRVTL